MSLDGFFRVEGYPGIAWIAVEYADTEMVIDQYDWCPGHPAEDCGKLHAAIGELVYCEPGCQYEIETDIVPDYDTIICVMVGDNRRFTFDKSDLTEIQEDDFCRGCGQIGCGHG
jgi:hypothetical protein